MRIALFTLESALSTAAVNRFLRGVTQGGVPGVEVALVGRSAPDHGGTLAALREARRHWRRSGPRLLPFLAVNYALPQWAATLRRLAGADGGWGELRAIAAAAGLPLVEVTDVNGPTTQAALRQARPDLILSFHFDRIFAPETLALAPRGGINLHPSLLPRHRGPVPTLWALAEEVPAFGVTVHRLAPRIDAGAVLAQRVVPLPPGTTASAAARALHEAGVPLLEEVLATLATGAEPVGRLDPLLPYCPFPPPDLLRALALRGRRAVDVGDLRAALQVRVG
jgi:hypothetical protein